MRVRSSFVAMVVEQMAPLGRVRSRRMFGGHGIYIDEHFVAIILNERLYLKTDSQSRAEFEARGLEPFVFTMKGKEVKAGYFEAPAEVFEDADAMQHWMRMARDAAMRAQQGKGKSNRRGGE